MTVLESTREFKSGKKRGIAAVRSLARKGYSEDEIQHEAFYAPQAEPPTTHYRWSDERQRAYSMGFEYGVSRELDLVLRGGKSRSSEEVWW